MGVVFNPISNEFFFSEKGKGAFLNEKKISVSGNNDVKKSLLVTGFPYDSSSYKPDPVTIFKKFMMLDIPIRRLGSAALDLAGQHAEDLKDSGTIILMHGMLQPDF